MSERDRPEAARRAETVTTKDAADRPEGGARQRRRAASGQPQPAPRPATQPADKPAAAGSPPGSGSEPAPTEPPVLAFLQQRHGWVPPLAALLTALAGLINVLSAITPSIRSRSREIASVVPGALSHSAAAVTLVSGIALLLLARGLRRRKKRAFRLVAALLTASVVLHVLKGLDVEEAVVALLLLVALLAFRQDFYAKGDPTTRWRALWFGLLLIVLSVALGVALIELRENRIINPHSFGDEVRHVLLGLVGIGGPLRFRNEATTDLVTQVLGGLGLFTLLTVLYLALRPPEPRPMLTPDDEQQMRALLAGRHGSRDSLGYFALRRDKSVVWSATGKACIAYRVVSGVMLASADPLGDPEAWPGAISEFLRVADEHAWTPGVIGCSEAGGTAWTRAGLQALEFGDEAVVDLDDFSLEGRAMRNVRQAVGRVERAGYQLKMQRVSDICPEDGRRLREEAAAWRGAETERGFSMALGRFGDPSDDQCVAVMALDAGDRLRGFLHFVPWGPDGLSLDLMRRDRDAENGINEFLIVGALREAAGLKVRRLSLNFAFFRSSIERGERLGAGPVIRTWRGLLVFLSRWWQIDSLYRFNAKFQPVWEPRFVCYPAAADLPRISLAMLEAEAFIVWPQPRLGRIYRAVSSRSSAELS